MGGIIQPSSRRILAPRRHRGSVSFNSQAFYGPGLTRATTTTFLHTITVPDDAVAMRVAFGNNTATPYTITGVAACPSTTLNDYINPTGGGTWKYLTFANGGAESGGDVDLPLAPATSIPAAVTIPGNSTNPVTGATNIPKLYWSDWNYISTLPPASGSARVMMLRAVGPAQTWYGIQNGTSGYTGVPAVNGGWDFSERVTNYDAVTSPATAVLAANTGNTTFHPFAVVQFIFKSPVVSLLSMGDSQVAGDSSSQGMNSATQQATILLCNSGIPTVHWNSAWGGTTTDVFWPTGNQSINAAHPSIVVMEGWSGNDSPINTTAAVDRELARFFATTHRIRQLGGQPILLTPMPRNASVMQASGVLSSWQYARNQLLAAKRGGENVLDVTPLLGDLTTGRFLPGVSTDDTHPNDYGHGLMAPPLAAAIRGLIAA